VERHLRHGRRRHDRRRHLLGARRGGRATVTFPPGAVSTTVPVQVLGDEVTESDERFVVSFTNPRGALMGGFWGLAFSGILEDD
jgi:hypothetical protein